MARHRRGEWLPDELANLAEALLALEIALGAPLADANAHEVAPPPVEPAAAAEGSPPVHEAPAEEAPAGVAATAEPAVLPVPVELWSLPGDETPAAEAPPMLSPPNDPARAETIAAMSPVEADDWLTSLASDPSGMLVLPASEIDDTVKDEYLIIDLAEEEGGPNAGLSSDPLPTPAANTTDILGPTNIFVDMDLGVGEAASVTAESNAADESGALPPPAANPLDVFAPTNILDESPPGVNEAAPLVAEPAVAETDQAAPEPAPELRFCTNCGAELRPGRRFCHRCGESVARMLAEALGDDAPPPAAPPPAAPPPSRDEWPTFISDAPRYETSAPPAPVPAMARFCNNCGLGLDANATVCPECGSRDIS